MSASAHSVGVLTKADLVGGGGPNAWQAATELARSIAEGHRTLFAAVVPVIGLLAEAGNCARLTDNEAHLLSTLAREWGQQDRETALLAPAQSDYKPSAVPVYFVGGSSRIAALSRLVHHQLGCTVKLIGDPQFVVSEGAALWLGSRLGGENLRVSWTQRVLDSAQDISQEARNAGQRAVDKADEALQDLKKRFNEITEKMEEKVNVQAWVWVLLAVVALIVLVLILSVAGVA